MKIRIWIFGLLAALVIALISSGTAFAGPSYIHTNYPGDGGMDCYLDQKISDTDYKFGCTGGDFFFSILVTPFPPNPLAPPKGCDLKGQNWTSGLFDQNWHHDIEISDNPEGLCTLSKMNENTWVLKVKAKYTPIP